MSFSFSPEQERLRETVRRCAETEKKPLAFDWSRLSGSRERS
jgi:hypothetical protein